MKMKFAYALALAASVSVAHAGEIFTVQEGSIPGSLPNLVTADLLTLRYQAFVDQSADGSFTEDGFFNVTGYTLNNAAVASQLNSVPPIGYHLYGTFQLEGSIAFVATTALATFDSGNFHLLVDPNQDTTVSIDASGNVIIGGVTADDFELAFSTTLIDPSQANIPLVGDQAASGGSYVVNFDDLQLTAQGELFFIIPADFYMRLRVTGENESFTPPLTAGEYQGILEGDASAEFLQVPEPGTLALLGLGLVAFGFGALRRRKVAA